MLVGDKNIYISTTPHTISTEATIVTTPPEQRVLNNSLVQISFYLYLFASSPTQHTLLSSEYKDVLINNINRDSLFINNNVKWY